MNTYLTLGLEHITDLNGYDHILFLVALCAPFALADWKRLLWLVTAFTVGHSLTLALAVLDLVHASSAWVEFLIPLTIAATSIKNLMGVQVGRQFQRQGDTPLLGGLYVGYGLALCFGLIHGLGFSNYLRSLLDTNIALPLLCFNLGLELGQLVIVAVLLATQWILFKLLASAKRWWMPILSGLALLVSVWMIWQRWP